MGLPLCESLNVVTLNCAIETSVPVRTNDQSQDNPEIVSVDDLKMMFPEQFDVIGNLPGEAHLYLEKDAMPSIDAPRKYPIHMEKKLKIELDMMESQGVIRAVEEHSDWCSSLTTTIKKNGTLRVCLDPKKLNDSLRRCPHKMKTIEEINHKFTGSTVFSKLDAKAGYWGVKLDKESELITTFRTPFGRYCFKRLPFGLNVSQDIFQQKMDKITERCKGVEGIADDVVVHGRDSKDHDKNLINFMNEAKKSGLTFTSAKCDIKKSSISFYGMVFSDKGMSPDESKVLDLHNMPAPCSKAEVQHFLGLITYLSLLSLCIVPVRRLSQMNQSIVLSNAKCLE